MVYRTTCPKCGKQFDKGSAANAAQALRMHCARMKGCEGGGSDPKPVKVPGKATPASKPDGRTTRHQKNGTLTQRIDSRLERGADLEGFVITPEDRHRTMVLDMAMAQLKQLERLLMEL